MTLFTMAIAGNAVLSFEGAKKQQEHVKSKLRQLLRISYDVR